MSLNTSLAQWGALRFERKVAGWIRDTGRLKILWLKGLGGYSRG